MAILGVIKAGGAFVLLDPGQPFERLQQICHEVKAELVVASRKKRNKCTGRGEKVM